MFGSSLRLMKSWGTFTSQLKGGTLIDTFFINTSAKAEEALKTLLVCPRLAVDTVGSHITYRRVSGSLGLVVYVWSKYIPASRPTCLMRSCPVSFLS